MKKFSKEEVMRIVRELHARLDEIYGGRLKGVYLYGSYARDDARDDSDIDVAVVLGGSVERWVERERIGELASEISLRENGLLTLFFMSETENSQKLYPIHRSIAREGIAV
jgi:predicted nucleotidyltransferase